MKRIIAAALLSIAAAFALPAPPAAADGVFARTNVVWRGAACIPMYFGWRAQTLSICSPNGTYTYTESNVYPGDAFGIDPIMGAASYIECAVFIDGTLVYFDSAYAGDGSDVTCSRVKL